MAREIFGPILPVVAYDTLDEVIERINDGRGRWRCTRSAMTRSASTGCWRTSCPAASRSTMPCSMSVNTTCPSAASASPAWALPRPRGFRDLLQAAARLPSGALERRQPAVPPYGKLADRMLAFLMR